MAFTPNGKTGYVTTNLGTVIPISTATSKPGKPIKVTLSPDGIAITPGGKTAYVSDPVLNTVTPVNLATRTVLRAIRSVPGPLAVVITPACPALPDVTLAQPPKTEICPNRLMALMRW
jgi:DNA-binding beta-propeller fold protein YncE